MAVRALNHPLATRYRNALVLGALREDVWYLPIPGTTWEHLSISHFHKAGAGRSIERLFKNAVREYRSGRIASAFVQLGRRHKPDASVNADCARALLPAGAGYTAAHLRLFLHTVGAT